MGGKHNVATITLTTLAATAAGGFALSLAGQHQSSVAAARGRNSRRCQPRKEGGHPDFSSVLENLIARLKDQPDDVEGWLMLGRTYAMMQRFNEAKDAYEKVLALAPENPEVITDYADIVAMTNNGSLIGKTP